MRALRIEGGSDYGPREYAVRVMLCAFSDECEAQQEPTTGHVDSHWAVRGQSWAGQHFGVRQPDRLGGEKIETGLSPGEVEVFLKLATAPAGVMS